MSGAVRAVVVVGALAMAVVACADEGDDANPTVPSFRLDSTTPTTTEATPATEPLDAAPPETQPTDSGPSETEPADTAPPSTASPTVAPETTGPADTTPASTAPSEASTTTTTTEPLHVQELILGSEGIGAAQFGAAPDGVLDYVTSVLGGNTGDTGWVDPFSFADCGAGGAATHARRVDWGVLSLLFSDGSPYATGRDHFIGYEYGRVGQIGDEPVGLHTEANVGLGSRVVDLYAEFPEAAVNEGDEDVGIPPNFYVSNVFYGLLTGTDPDDVVTVIFGGYGCFD